MTGITRYLVRQIAVALILVAVALTATIWLSQSLRFIDTIINHGLPLDLSLWFLALMLPSLAALVLPIALFLAVTFVYYKLIMDSELVVLRASGLSHLALARPALIVGAVTMLACYLLTLYLLPASYRSFKDLQYTIRNSYAQVLLQAGVFTDLGTGLTLYVRARDPEGGLRGILVHDTRDAEKPVTYTAARGVLYAGATGPQIVMENGSYQEASARTGAVSILNFEKASIGLNDLMGAGEERYRDPQERFVNELLQPDPALPPEVRQRLIAEGHQRLASPLYTLAFAIAAVAVLLVGTSGPRGRWTRIAVALGIAAALQILSLALLSAATRTAAAVPAMYVAPVLAMVVGLILLSSPKGIRPRSLKDQGLADLSTAG
jgi:lipopolysaccharide export system permease protein